MLLVLFYGVPGAGKSSLIRSCIERLEFEREAAGIAAEYTNICLDELLTNAAASGATNLAEWTDDTRVLWKSCREAMLLRLRGLISESARAERSIVFLDDNFQLKSMRKHIFRLAQAGLYCKVSLEVQ